ncbi:MAG: hypothetical protein ACOYEC_04385 [Christensenellales bacterium]|jgi:hypothetical protein|nr:hypothetical protein [Clostridiales bacterium]
MADNFIKKGSAVCVVVESISSKEAFPDPKAKAYYVELLALAIKKFPQIKALSYAVLKNSAYLLLFTSDDNALNNMIIQLNESYNNYYNERFGDNGYVFRLPPAKNKIKKQNIISAIAHIHKLPEYHNIAKNYRKYKFSSCYPIFKGWNDIVDKDFLLEITDTPTLDGVTYTQWHRQGMCSQIKQPKAGGEKFSQALDVCLLRYGGDSLYLDEGALIQVIIDVNERCFKPYEKIASKLGVKNRRDILIDIVSSMVFDRGYAFLDAVNQLQIEHLGVFTLLMEVIVNVNEKRGYGYDYIINKLQVEDSEYFILEEIIRRLNRIYGMDFVEVAKKFSLQNNLIDLRLRTGI